jgi:DNA-binding MarR family transcriptional regulator
MKDDHRLAHLLKDARRAMERALQARLVEHGVPFGHWTYLRILWQDDGLTQRELSARAGVMEPTTFGALRAMEERGYIERRQRPDNRKNVYVHLTRKGRALERKLLPLAQEVNRVAVRGMTRDEVARLRMLLLAMIDNLGEDEKERAA